ncbi:hypothetical protein KM1_042880, partial [Entamoeba histolytica HM-3:IMSS]
DFASVYNAISNQ